MSEPREQWEPLFQERVERLAKFAQIKAPASIITMAVEMVYRAAFCAFPAEMGSALAHAQLEHQRQNSFMCVACGVPSGDLSTICEVCISEGKEDDEDAEFVK